MRGNGVVSFTDVDGDTVEFSLRQDKGSEGSSLEVKVGERSPSRVLRLVLAEEGRAVRFLTEPDNEGMQVIATEEVVARGDLSRVGQLAEAAGLLPGELREAVLRLAYEYATQGGNDGRRCADPSLHFHFLGGAGLNGLHWRADESVSSLGDSLGVMASVVYRDGEAEAEAVRAYASEGMGAKTITA